MDSPIPVDIIEGVIDQAVDDPRSLCQLALTCSQLLPRSRYHLLAWHVCLRNKSQLDDFYAYLRANLQMGPIIRAVKLLLSSKGISWEGALEKEGLLAMIPVSLLTVLPNLQYWRIHNDTWWIRPHLFNVVPLQLACLRMYTTSITSLDVVNVKFLNATQFARFLSTFPALRSLLLSTVQLRMGTMEMTLAPAREQLGKQLHLTSLKMKGDVDRCVMMLLLEIGRSTIEHLELGPMSRNVRGRDRVHDLVCGMQALRSITTILNPQLCDNDTQQVLVDAWEVMMRLPMSPSRTHIIDANILGDVHFALAKEPLLERSRQLEQILLGQTSHSIVFTASGIRRRRKAFWTTALGQYFPELHQRGRLRIECDRPSNTYDMTGHDASVFCLAVSPDSKWIASGSRDTTIILWDAWRSSIIQEWLSYAGSVNCLAFSPDSHLLASGCSDGSVAIWRISEGCKRVTTLHGHTQPVDTCAWASDGILLASGDRKGLRLWDTQSFTQRHCFENAAEDWSPYVCFSPDLRWFAFWGGMKDCEVWNTSDGHLHIILHAPARRSSRAAFDPTSRRIIISTPGWTLSGWDVETAEGHLVLRGHEGDVQDIAFSPNGEWVLSASKDGTAKMWDSHTGELILSFEGHTDEVCMACFSPDGKYVASVSKDKTVRLWRTSDGSSVRIFTEHTDCVTHVLFSPDGETVCSGARDGTVFIRQLRDIIL